LFLKDQEVHSVGKSYESYNFHGNQFALAINAATHVASSRPDLIKKFNVSLPKTFDELFALTDTGLLAMPEIPIHILMNFYVMCCLQGGDPFQREDYIVSEPSGIKALKVLKSLADRLNPEFFNWNPIQVYEAMTTREDLVYCTWAYG
jgi:multiple sugar transport system substrate-binding protein